MIGSSRSTMPEYLRRCRETGVGRASHLDRRVGWTTTMMAGSQESKAAYPSKATSHRRRQVDGVQDGGPRSQKEFRSVPGTRITENKYRLPSGSHAVHPRVCGEHSRPSKVIATCCGSSPRMRGTLNQILDWDDSERFIPAYAGNTAGSTGVSSPMTVHPRVCGEHPVIERCRLNIAGSSPRMRGTRILTD